MAWHGRDPISDQTICTYLHSLHFMPVPGLDAMLLFMKAWNIERKLTAFATGIDFHDQTFKKTMKLHKFPFTLSRLLYFLLIACFLSTVSKQLFPVSRRGTSMSGYQRLPDHMSKQKLES